MGDTRENILSAALRLFARHGYQAVSVSMIADELGMAKSALYKHFRSKRDIFDCIVARMSQMDAAQARAYAVPTGTHEDMPDVYAKTPLDQIKVFSQAQFRYWTEEAFPACFRNMLTLEQYRDPEMSALFQQYLAAGPLGYVEDLFFGMIGERERAKQLAMRFYAPLFLLYSIYDGAKDKDAAVAMMREHIGSFTI